MIEKSIPQISIIIGLIFDAFNISPTWPLHMTALNAQDNKHPRKLVNHNQTTRE